MGIKANVTAISYAPAHLQAAISIGQNVASLHQDVLLQCQELLISLNRLKSTMIAGDANIATINTQITALS